MLAVSCAGKECWTAGAKHQAIIAFCSRSRERWNGCQGQEDCPGSRAAYHRVSLVFNQFWPSLQRSIAVDCRRGNPAAKSPIVYPPGKFPICRMQSHALPLLCTVFACGCDLIRHKRHALVQRAGLLHQNTLIAGEGQDIAIVLHTCGSARGVCMHSIGLSVFADPCSVQGRPC